MNTVLYEPIIKGEKVSRAWLEENNPDALKNIASPVDDVNLFLKDLNSGIYNETLLQELRKKRGDLISYTDEVKVIIDEEKQRLQKELDEVEIEIKNIGI